MTVNAAAYVEAFEAERGEHELADGVEATKSITLVYANDAWKVANGETPISFDVTCVEEAPEAPDMPTKDELDGIFGKAAVKIDCASNVGHADKAYGLIDGAYTVGAVVANAEGRREYNGTEYMMTNAGLSTRTLNRESITINGVVNTGTDAAPVYEPVSTTYTAGNMYNINGTLTSGEKMIQDYWSTYLNESANFITETNWLRLRSISISYDFKDLIKGQDILKGLTATLSGTNLWLWTNYEGLDPENSAAGAGVVGSGSAFIDYCGVPSTAGFSFGINLTF